MEVESTIIVALVTLIIGGLIGYFSGIKLESYKFVIRRREQAIRIAEFFAKWIKYGGKEKELLSEKELIDYYEDLTRMSFEMSLWIDDEEVLKKIMSRLVHKKDAIRVREILIEVRDLISKSKTKSFKADDIVIWPGN
ncbi:MAG: hypothetical protein ABIJ17_01385 [Patescibacteria group bacterium]